MLLVVLFVTCCLAYAFWSYMKPRSQLSPPMYPGALPIIGHAHLLIADQKKIWEREKGLYDYCVQKNDVVEARLGPHSLYVISDPEDCLAIANTCLEKPYLYHFGKEMYNRGLLTADVSSWKPHRKLLNPAFNQQVLQNFVEEFVVQAKSLVSQLASKVGKEAFDVHTFSIKNLLGIACRKNGTAPLVCEKGTIFFLENCQFESVKVPVYFTSHLLKTRAKGTSIGLKMDEHSETVKDYAHAVDDMLLIYMIRVQRVWLHIPYIFNRSSYKKKHDNNMKVMKDITEAAITNRKANLKSIDNVDNSKNSDSSANFKPLLDQMLDIADQHGVFTENDIRDHLDTMIAAAYETSAITLTFVLILIGSHLDVQERMYKELQEVLKNEERDLNRHDLPKLVYMEAVIKETLRIYPPAPRIGRCSSTDVQLKKYVLPAYSTLVISVYALNRHSSWGADADQFKPERWLDPATLPDNPNTFASFSLGRRNCIGKLYGMMAIKTNLAYILRSFRVKSDIANLVTRCDVLLKPVNGHLISLESRS